MKLDVVTKGIPFFHMSVVAVMVLAGVSRIFTYTSLFWVYCTIMSIPLTENYTLKSHPCGDTDICSLWELAS